MNSVESLSHPSSGTVQFTSFFSDFAIYNRYSAQKGSNLPEKSLDLLQICSIPFAKNLSYWYQKTMIAPNLSVHASATSPSRGDGKP